MNNNSNNLRPDTNMIRVTRTTRKAYIYTH